MKKSISVLSLILLLGCQYVQAQNKPATTDPKKASVPSKTTKENFPEPKELAPAVQIYFKVNQSEIAPAEMAKLSTLVKKLKDIPEYRLVLTGHTDSTGNDDYNMELSKDRVDAVYDALAEMEINEDFMLQKYFGRSKPRTNETDKEMAARNRRVEITIIEKPKEAPKPVVRNTECDGDTSINTGSGVWVTLNKCDFKKLNKTAPGKGIRVTKISDPLEIIKSGQPLVFKGNEGLEWVGIVKFQFSKDSCLEHPVTVTLDPQDYEGYRRSRMKVLVKNEKTGKLDRSKDRAKTLRKKTIKKDAVKFEVTTKCPTSVDPEGAICIAGATGKNKMTEVVDKTGSVDEVYIIQESPVTIIPADKYGNKFVVKYAKLTDPKFVFKLSDGSYTQAIPTGDVKKMRKKEIEGKFLRKKYKIKGKHLIE